MVYMDWMRLAQDSLWWTVMDLLALGNWVLLEELVVAKLVNCHWTCCKNSLYVPIQFLSILHSCVRVGPPGGVSLFSNWCFVILSCLRRYGAAESTAVFVMRDFRFSQRYSMPLGLQFATFLRIVVPSASGDKQSKGMDFLHCVTVKMKELQCFETSGITGPGKNWLLEPWKWHR
jgi:hypothetical protein